MQNNFELRWYQQDTIQHLLESTLPRECVCFSTGGGKCLGVNTPILMHDGSIKNVQDIVIDDQLMGPDSCPRNVLSITSGQEMMYEIKLKNGESFRCNESHILSLISNCNTKKFKKGHIYHFSVKEYLQLSKTDKHILKSYKCGVEFKSQQISIDPYLLGVWLGDGDSKEFTITNMDIEIEKYLYSISEKNAWKVIKKPNGKTKAFRYSILPLVASWGGGLRGWLKTTKLYNNKHIPDNYLINDRETRLKLLAGLIDTDGYLSHNAFEIFIMHEQLAKDTIYLCKSLGFNVHVGNKKNVRGFRLNISGEGLEQIPVLLERKRASKRQQIKNALHYGFTVTQLNVDNYYGFEIDGDRRFLLGDFTVTHNTVIFCGFAVMQARRKPMEKIMIAVNREELLTQAVDTLKYKYGIHPGVLIKETKTKPVNQICVAMVETLARRMSKWSFSEYTTLIVDECHLGNFNKILNAFQRVIGFSATPIYQKKGNCLADFYNELYISIQTSDLIQAGFLADAKTYVPKLKVNPKDLKIDRKNDDYDETQMGEELSKVKFIDQTIQYCDMFKDDRMLIFNSGIKHSHEVTRAMRSSGFEAYHVDGDTPKELRKEYFKRLNTEPGFKLNNVGIATLGFDAPRIKSVMLNRLTKSLALYNQVCGRGSRPIEAGTDELMPEGKKDFNILDMHGSAVDMGEWQDDRNWTALFQQGKRKNNDGVAAKKICPQCDLLISKFAKTCPDCGYIFDMASALGSKDELNEEFDPQLVLFTKVKTQVHKYIEQAKEKDYNLFWALRQTNQALIKDIEKGTLTYTNYVEGMYNAGQEFCRKLGKRYDQFKRDYIDKLIDEFDKKNSEENAQLYNEKEEERNIYELII